MRGPGTDVGKMQGRRGDALIVDELRNSPLYRGLGTLVAQAFDYLHNTDLLRAAAGTFEIKGRQVYASVQEYISLDPAQGAWEAHRRYIDLQCVVAGVERIGYARVGRMSPGRYDPERDLLPLTGAGDFLTLGPGEFMLLFPGDAHMPRIAVAAPEYVRKVVVKIAVAP